MLYEAIIIGFGKGGKTLAARLGGQGKKVLMVEQSEMMYGGTCINVGCIPSKSLVNSAAEAAKAAKADYASWEEKASAYRLAVEEKRRLTATLRRKNYDKLASNPNITVLVGTASFLNQNTIRIETATGTVEASAPQIFINTGSMSVHPPIPGLENNTHVYFSDTLMDLSVLPKRLLIIGGGYIGLEFASMYANFGSEVTVFQDGELFLPREDRDIAEMIRELLEGQGVAFRLGAKITEIGEDGTVSYIWNGEQCSQHGEAVLAATGRRPNTDMLNAQLAGIQLTSRGAVAVDELMRTNVPGIWAMGDVVGGLQFTYVSLDDYRIIAPQLEGRQEYTQKDRLNVPYNVFMSTPFARVGLNEQEAKEKGYKYRICRLPAAAIPKAQVLGKPEGMLKAIVEEETGRILGVMLLCAESYEMINIVKLAMELNGDYTVLRDQIFTHPTMSEALNDLFSL